MNTTPHGVHPKQKKNKQQTIWMASKAPYITFFEAWKWLKVVDEYNYLVTARRKKNMRTFFESWRSFWRTQRERGSFSFLQGNLRKKRKEEEEAKIEAFIGEEGKLKGLFFNIKWGSFSSKLRSKVVSLHIPITPRINSYPLDPDSHHYSLMGKCECNVDNLYLSLLTYRI